jgi:hypothetical protein
MAKTNQPNPLAGLQSSRDALESKLPHLAHLGSRDQMRARDLLHRSDAVLKPEGAAELAAEMDAITTELDRIVARQAQHAAKLEEERRAQAAMQEAARAELARRKENARLNRIALGAAGG